MEDAISDPGVLEKHQLVNRVTGEGRKIVGRGVSP
jgi:hypothetical protein